jgi:hypothetical protein
MPDDVIPGTEGVPPTNTAPTGSPASAPQPAAGEIAQAKANVQIALKVLEHTLPLLGADSEDGQAVHKAIGLLSKRFSGDKSENIAPAELMQMSQSVPDEWKQAMATQQGGGGAAPGGAPPGV